MSLAALGWQPFFADHFARLADPALTPARVGIQYSRLYQVYTESDELTVELAGRVRHRAAGAHQLPAVGDWVALDVKHGVIRHVLPRRNQFSRKAAGRDAEEQVVAANIDTAFLMMGLDADFNLKRIDRYLVSTRQCGAAPVIVLNKADLCDDLAASIEQVQEVTAGAPVHSICSLQAKTVEVLRQYLRRGQTVALLGSSGVGKSTLINRLLGSDMLRTQEVRLSDRRGRHTTTRRELIVLPDGGLIIDTPGLRELQLWSGGEAFDESFDDILALAAECYFTDCQHQAEPKCAVKRAVDNGRLSAVRLENYLKLQQELERLNVQKDERERLAAKGKLKSIHKAQRNFRPRE